ncbi:hypothetical protein LINPERHAP1_LOCUS32648, partial [Linum perenne]
MDKKNVVIFHFAQHYFFLVKKVIKSLIKRTDHKIGMYRTITKQQNNQHKLYLTRQPKLCKNIVSCSFGHQICFRNLIPSNMENRDFPMIPKYLRNRCQDRRHFPRPQIRLVFKRLCENLAIRENNGINTESRRQLNCCLHCYRLCTNRRSTKETPRSSIHDSPFVIIHDNSVAPTLNGPIESTIANDFHLKMRREKGRSRNGISRTRSSNRAESITPDLASQFTSQVPFHFIHHRLNITEHHSVLMFPYHPENIA